jgi:hypothetical protein
MLDAALAPLDWMRARVLRAAVAVPALRRVIARRDTRIAAQATVGVAVTALATFLAPMLLFALGPIVLGVPHVASDVRYLLVRPRLPRVWVYGGFAIIAAMVGLRVVEAWILPHLPATRLEAGLGFVWILAGALFGAHLAGTSRRLAYLLPALALLGAVIAARPHDFLIVFPFLHNFVALALWILLFRQVRRLAWMPLLAVGLGCAFFLTGAASSFVATSSFGGATLAEAAAAIAPGLEAEWALRLALVFVFTQGVHYAVWIGWIPQENLECEGTHTWRQTAHGLGRDFGQLGFAALAVTLLVVWAAATRDVYGTRSLYLGLANFHAMLEVATLAFVLAAGIGLRRQGAARASDVPAGQ